MEMKKDIDHVPTVRIPFLIEMKSINKNLQQAISRYENEGYTTFFIFKDGNRDKLLAELKDISSGWLLFLNHIERVYINLAYLSKTVEIRRKVVKENQYLLEDKNNKQNWLIIYGQDNTAVAFKYDEHIIPCSFKESLFHCFLPTQDSLGYPFKANADFSTDPSRKHIIEDDVTKRSITNIANLIVELLVDTSFESQSYLIDLIASRSGISEASSTLDNEVLTRLKTVRWIPLQNGTKVSATEHRIVPSWFDAKSREIVFKNIAILGSDEVNSEAIQKAHNIDDLFIRCGCKFYDTHEYGLILGNIDAVLSLNDSFLGKLWGYTLRSVLFSSSSIASFFLKDRAKQLIIVSAAEKSVDFSEEFIQGLKSVLNTRELLQTSKISPFKGIEANSNVSRKYHTKEKKQEIQGKMEYSRWKTPIQNCMVSEYIQGHSPKDVSKKGLGYDIESTDKNGDTRYFSVKSVEILGDSFVLSEEEYAFAEQHCASYGVYVIENQNPENNMLIENMNTLEFEKRVRAWEWVSSQYEVVKKSNPKELSALDSKFMKEFSLEYLNRVQIAFLETICTGTKITDFESQFSCKATSIMTQVNSIVDFYLGDTLINDDMTIKSKYIGALNYMISQMDL